MRVAVIGAGVIGVTTAYELAVDGHEVTVFERRGTVASGCSFANAGLVAPGYVAPWAAPGMPAKVVRHLFAAHAPVRIAGPLDAATLGWAWRWWRACRPQAYRANRARMHRLAHFSRERLLQLTTAAAPRLRARAGLPRSPAQRPRAGVAEAGVRALAELGVAPVVLDAAGCRAIEPGLNPATPLHAGIYSKDDEVGNCREFTHLLRKEAERAGAVFRFNAHVEQIRAGKRADAARPAGARTMRATRRCARATPSEWPTTQPQAGETTEPSFDASSSARRSIRGRLLKPHRRAPAAHRRARLLGDGAAAPRRPAPPPRAARGADGRALQGRDQPPRPARPRRRQRRDRRRHRAPERAAPRRRSTRCSTTGSRA